MAILIPLVVYVPLVWSFRILCYPLLSLFNEVFARQNAPFIIKKNENLELCIEIDHEKAWIMFALKISS